MSGIPPDGRVTLLLCGKKVTKEVHPPSRRLRRFLHSGRTIQPAVGEPEEGRKPIGSADVFDMKLPFIELLIKGLDV